MVEFIGAVMFLMLPVVAVGVLFKLLGGKPTQQGEEVSIPGWDAPAYTPPQPAPLMELEWEYGGGNATATLEMVEAQARLRRRASNPKHN